MSCPCLDYDRERLKQLLAGSGSSYNFFTPPSFGSSFSYGGEYTHTIPAPYIVPNPVRIPICNPRPIPRPCVHKININTQPIPVPINIPCPVPCPCSNTIDVPIHVFMS